MVNLASVDKCTGCRACVNSCVHGALTMTEDKEGFLMPVVNNDKCVECHLCEKICPIVSPYENKNMERPKAYAMWSLQDRTKSSSGGAFSAYARMILKNGGVVFGAAFDRDMRLRHIGVETIEELDDLRGSKYVQSDVNACFGNIKSLLKDGKSVLFCGTPCQVAGLKSFLRKDYDNLLTLDLVCHGVPSVAVFKAYLKKLSTRFAGKGKIDGFEFRRRNNWGFSPTVSLSGKLTKIYDGDNAYMNAFDKSAIFRNSCYSCPFAKLPRVGDCTIADFWGIGRHGAPFRHDVQKGVSLVMVNNNKGHSFTDKLEDVFIEERDLDEALIENHNITHPSVAHPKKNDIIAAFLDEDIDLDVICKRYHLTDRSIKGVIKELADRLHVFDGVKFIYNKIRTL